MFRRLYNGAIQQHREAENENGKLFHIGNTPFCSTNFLSNSNTRCPRDVSGAEIVRFYVLLAISASMILKDSPQADPPKFATWFHQGFCTVELAVADFFFIFCRTIVLKPLVAGII